MSDSKIVAAPPHSQQRDPDLVIDTDGGYRIYSVWFTKDGKQVLSGGDEWMVRRWQADNGLQVGKPTQAGSAIWATSVSPDGRWLVCGLKRSKPNIAVWNAETGEKVRDMDGHEGYVWSIDISADSTRFATSGDDYVVFIWSMITGEKLISLLPAGSVVAVRFSPNGDRIAIATMRSIRIFNGVSGHLLLDTPCLFPSWSSTPLAWSADGGQLFAASFSDAKCFDTSSGTLLTTWAVPGCANLNTSAIVLSRDEKFMAVIANTLISFWDSSTHTQIGPVIEHKSSVWSIVFSPENDRIVTGEDNGKVTLRSLRDILPETYFRADRLKLPLMNLDRCTFDSWMQGDLASVERFLSDELLHPSNSSHHAHTLAHRSLVRSRMKLYDLAISDAKKSIEVRRTAIGHIAIAIFHAGDGEPDAAMRVYDLAFSEGVQIENNLLLLIKAVVLFECGKHDDAISRIDDLIDIVDNKSIYFAARARLFLSSGSTEQKRDHGRSLALLVRALEADHDSLPKSHQLLVLSLMFGWKLDSLANEIRQYIQDNTQPFEVLGDAAMRSNNPSEANVQYSHALCLHPPNHGHLFIKRSEARAMLALWDDSLKDAEEAIEADPQSVQGYERKYTALHALQRYGEAVEAVNHMLSAMERSSDPETCELVKQFISPFKLEEAINTVARDISKTCPIVLIDVKSGCLCNGPERMSVFKSELEYKELVSSMIRKLDRRRIRQVVAEYFRYVTFSHVWQGEEPSYQKVKLAGSIWDLDGSLLNDKLRSFCKLVHEDGYRWAWSDTCCIDKTINTVLTQSLKMMYKWYETSAATFVHLVDVDSQSALVNLPRSIWMTRAWTSQELLVPKVIRFYDCNWKLYHGDARPNHKESPEIMQELAYAIGISHEIIKTFNPDDLSIREKLRLAAKRAATVEEDIAYSLIGIFQSDIHPLYGEEYAALGHLLEEIVARSGEVTVLAWTGKSSLYNSCLPDSLAVYHEPLSAPLGISDADMNSRVSELKTSLPQAVVIPIYRSINDLSPARFANRRLYLPSVIFRVKKLDVQSVDGSGENYYRANVAGIGDVDFCTLNNLSVREPGRLAFVHPWICDLRDPHGFDWGNEPGDESEEYTRALRLVVRLQQPFRPLLLQQQSSGVFRRVAAEHEIVVPGIDHRINFAKDNIRIDVVEVL